VARWEPGAKERLQVAALELFSVRGFENTTAAEIAQSVGLTERTFFRHFADKRDVLFYGQDEFLQTFRSGIDDAPPEASPLQIVESALSSAASFFPNDRRARSHARQAVINANPALRERERHKLADLATMLAGALRARGIGESTATLAAESAVTVFSIAIAQWLRDDERRTLSLIVTDVFDELQTMTAARPRLRADLG